VPHSFNLIGLNIADWAQELTAMPAILDTSIFNELDLIVDVDLQLRSHA
jgi:hypothetical protein